MDFRDPMQRQAVLTASGFETESDMLDAFSPLVTNLCAELLTSESLSLQQRRGLQVAGHDFPIALRYFHDLLKKAPFQDEEQRRKIIFAFAKTLDDLLSLGSLASVVGTEATFCSFGQEGGREGGARRRKTAEEGWEAQARPKIVAAWNKRPSISIERLATEVIKDGVSMSLGSVKGLIKRMDADKTIQIRKRPTANPLQGSNIRG